MQSWVGACQHTEEAAAGGLLRQAEQENTLCPSGGKLRTAVSERQHSPRHTLYRGKVFTEASGVSTAPSAPVTGSV